MHRYLYTLMYKISLIYPYFYRYKLEINLNPAAITVVSDDFVTEKTICQNLAGAYVVYDQKPAAVGRFSICNQANVGNGPAQVPANYITRIVIFDVVRHGQLLTKTRKKFHQVWHTPVINIFVGRF